MNKQEVATLLVAIAAIDDRVDPDAMRIAMWYEVLSSSMTLEFARERVIKHYAVNRNVIMPADFNEPWKFEYNKQLSNEQARALEVAASAAVPMPKALREQLSFTLPKP